MLMCHYRACQLKTDCTVNLSTDWSQLASGWFCTQLIFIKCYCAVAQLPKSFQGQFQGFSLPKDFVPKWGMASFTLFFSAKNRTLEKCSNFMSELLLHASEYLLSVAEFTNSTFVMQIHFRQFWSCCVSWSDWTQFWVANHLMQCPSNMLWWSMETRFVGPFEAIIRKYICKYASLLLQWCWQVKKLVNTIVHPQWSHCGSLKSKSLNSRHSLVRS